MALGETATRWYATRRMVKDAAGLVGSIYDDIIDSYLESASADIERDLKRRFIPEMVTKDYRWPRIRSWTYPQVLYLEDDDLLAVTLLEAKAQDASPMIIPATDYFLEPVNLGPPYSRIEIDLSSTSAFEAGDTPQRSLAVTGRWAASEQTRTAGAVRSAGGVNASVTSLLCSDSSLIDVGDTLLIGSEAMFVSGVNSAAEEHGDLLNGAITQDTAASTVTVDDGSRYQAGEVILVDSELMLIRSISANALTVMRAHDGSQIAAHADDTPVSVLRTLTVVRGVNGTTPATHALSDAISAYSPPGVITDLCKALALGHLKQGQSGWTGHIAGNEGGVQVRMVDLFHLRNRAREEYLRVTI